MYSHIQWLQNKHLSELVSELTVIDLVRLSLLLVDEDDGDKDDDLSHDAEEGPEGSQAAAHTQMDLGGFVAQIILSKAFIVTHILVDVKVINSESGIVRIALDRILSRAINRLKEIEANWKLGDILYTSIMLWSIRYGTFCQRQEKTFIKYWNWD